MIAGKRVCVVLPAYNAAATLRQTVAEIDRHVADDIILVDDLLEPLDGHLGFFLEVIVAHALIDHSGLDLVRHGRR